MVLRIGSHPLVYSVVFVLGVGALVFFLGIVPLVHMLQPGGTASLADATAKNVAARNVLDAQNKLATAAATLSTSDRDMLAYALPAEPDEPGLAVIFKSLAQNSGVRMSSIDITEPQGAITAGGNGVGEVEITVALDNVSYDKLKIVLTAVENSLRLFDVRGLSFSPSTGSTSLLIHSYYLINT